MRLITTMVALILLAIPAKGNSSNARLKAFDETCAIMRINCAGINKPIVIYTNLMGEFRLWGAYVHGEPFLFIDPDAPVDTYVHELTHYLLWEVGLFRKDRCMSEEMARRVAAIWMGEAYEDDWRRQYRCTKANQT